MRRTPEPLVEQAIHLRQMGYSFRQIAARIPGLSRSAAHRAARNVPFLMHNGKGWPNRRGWRWLERKDPHAHCIDPLDYGALLNMLYGPPK